MASHLKHWRDAATIILAAKCTNPVNNPNLPTSIAKAANKYDYKILMLKRSGKSKFMPNTFVWPGGMVHKSDYSENWLKFRPIKSRNTQITLQNIPPIFAKEATRSVLSHVALGICAIRETFEESGILLCLDENGNSVILHGSNLPQMPKLRDIVNKDASQFLPMCETLKVAPDLDAISLWSDWLTPNHLTNLVATSGRRFDTVFYFCGLHEEVQALHCDEETTESQWSTPVEILYHHRVGSYWIAPPQQYEMCRLAQFHHFQELCLFAQQRQQLGARCWLPVRVSTTDGVVSILPGDSMYPKEVDVYGESSMPKMDKSLRELRTESSKVNRVEIAGPHDIIIRSNITDPCGHRTPLDEEDIFGMDIKELLKT